MRRILDRIDEIVPPGTTLNPADTGFQNPALKPRRAAARRRRAWSQLTGPAGRRRSMIAPATASASTT